MNYYEHHIGDYAKATRHLTMLEHGAYTMLLQIYYDREKPFEADLMQICRLAGARSDAEREAVEAILKEFFTLEDGFYWNKRADEEIEKFNKKSEKAKVSAAASVASRQRSANAQRSFSVRSTLQTPDTNNQTPDIPPIAPPSGVAGDEEPSAKPEGYPADFEAFWSIYPRRTGKGAAAKAYRRAKQRIGPGGRERIEAAVRAHLKAWAGKDPQYIPHPATWLNQARWDDEVTPDPSPPGKAVLPHKVGRNQLGVGG